MSVGVQNSDLFFPDIEEQPFHSLDAVVQWRPHPEWALKLKLRNLLFDTRDYAADGFVTQRREVGMSGSLGVSYSPQL